LRALLAAPLALLLLDPSALSAQTPPRPKKSSVLTPTRTAVLFGGLERRLAEAAAKMNGAVLEELLADDFELLAAAHPEAPVPLDTWQDALYAAPPKSFLIDSVSVREIGADAALVSFVYEQVAASEKGLSGRFAYVDLWVRDKGRPAAWRLQSRFAAPAVDAPVPGWAAAPAIDKKF
jgi:hypothetical protein